MHIELCIALYILIKWLISYLYISVYMYSIYICIVYVYVGDDRISSAFAPRSPLALAPGWPCGPDMEPLLLYKTPPPPAQARKAYPRLSSNSNARFIRKILESESPRRHFLMVEFLKDFRIS